MTENLVQVGPALDPARYVATDQTVWFAEILAASAEDMLLGLPEDQRFAAEIEGADPETYPGVYGVFPLTLSVPGPQAGIRQLPAAGLTWVGVHPDHRRKGVLTAMMRHHFEQVHATAGTHVSVLHASEPAIYGRHGYGLASLELDVKLGRGTKLTAPHLEEEAGRITTRMRTAGDEDVPRRMRECHAAAAPLGAVVGELGYYARVCQTFPEHSRDKEPLRVLFAREDGKDVGFALFRRTHKWESGRPAGELHVWTVIGTPAAQLVLLRRLLDFDLMGTVKIGVVGPDDPLLHWVGGPRGTAEVGTYDSLWVRLVDLPDALQDRTWSAPCDVVVDVEDRAAPWNQGTWRVRAGGDGRATVERSPDDPDLRLDVAALGAAYLGGGNLLALQRAGFVAEQRQDKVAELWRALRSDVAPSAAVGF